MRKVRITTLMFFICLALKASAKTSVAKAGDKTEEPQKYVLDHTEFPEQGLRQFDCSQCAVMKDVVFISPASDCGNAGCNYFLFKKEGASFIYKTTIFLHASGFQFLKSSHEGLNDFISYARVSAFEGEIATHVFDGREYKLAGKAQTIKSEDFDKHIKPEPVKQVSYSKDLKKEDQ